MRREYRSTYRDTLVASEKLMAGKWWEPRPAGTAPNGISVELGLASELNVTIGDTITWDVQGVAIPTVIRNMREVNWARFEPNFFVVFEPGILEGAPHSALLQAMPVYVITHPLAALLGLAAYARAPSLFGVETRGRRWRG